MSEESHLLVEDHDQDQVRVLKLNRAKRRNALTVDLVRDTAIAIETAPSDGLRSVVVTGSGSAFCSGGDLPVLAGVAEGGALAVSEVVYKNFHRLVRAISASPLPVIAAINGPALGAGLDLALICDVRVAGTRATFGSAWLNAGLVPGMAGARTLSAAVTSSRAAEMLLTGRVIDAATALEWGLVNRVVAEGELIEDALSIGRRVASLSEVAVARTKASQRRALDDGLENELAVLGAVQGTLLTGPDFQAVVDAMVRSQAAPA
jgi:2-(1,2-epoxy-1,2-dihydrophenyl)acetyl-CoA isomerase